MHLSPRGLTQVVDPYRSSDPAGRDDDFLQNAECRRICKIHPFLQKLDFITDNCRIDLKFDQDPIKLRGLAESFGRIDNQLTQNTSVVFGKLRNIPIFECKNRVFIAEIC